MKDGNVNDFLDHMHYEEVACIYNGFKYFFNAPGADQETRIYHFEIYKMLPDDTFVDVIFEIDNEDPNECIKAFIPLKLFDGKSFWEAESDMTWVDW